MNLPNKITYARIAGIALFVFILSSSIQRKEIISAVVFIILAATDALDGFIARRNNQVTMLGKFIDPLADKLLVAAALIFLIGKGVEAWMAFLIIAREFSVTGMRIIAASQGTIIAANIGGKMKTVSQIVGIIAVLLQFRFLYQVMLIATAITIASGIQYLWQARSLLK